MVGVSKRVVVDCEGLVIITGGVGGDAIDIYIYERRMQFMGRNSTL